MPQFIIRSFIESDIPQVVSLQQAYQQSYPHASVVPGEVYRSAGFAGGQNIFCAVGDSGRLLGYAPLFPTPAEQPEYPDITWAEVKALPGLDNWQEVKDALFQRLFVRARETARPDHRTRLTFQYHPSETAAIDFFCSRGGSYSESVYRLVRDLSSEIQVPPPPAGIEVRPWHMDTEAEQQAYIHARNEAFPDSPTALADWQNFLRSQEWKHGGASITAFAGSEIAGSVITYWDEAVSAQVGRKIGFTEYIFTREKWRGRGLAACMITRALQYLKDHNRQLATLEVKAANENALNLYLRLGYEKVDETRLYTLDL